MPRHQRLRHISDEELYQRLGDAFLDIMLCSDPSEVASAHIRFSRFALEQQRRVSARKKPVEPRSEGTWCGECLEVHD